MRQIFVAAGAGEVVGLGFNGITEMQQMTSTVCSSATSGLEGRLKDTRDQKIYWVGKLPDGKCWMTQNLDLDLSTSVALTSEKSDVTSSWTPGYDTQTTLNEWGTDAAAQKSYDPGDYAYTTPSVRNDCGTSGITSLSQCTSKGWVELMEDNLAGWTVTYNGYFVDSTSYVSTDGQSVCNKTAGALFGDSTYSQCRVYYYTGGHYLAGNYYTYAAATAGTGSSATTNGANASGSICPKGWKLPTGTGSGEFKALLNGLTVAQITSAPYYFVYGGYVGSSYLGAAGNTGYYRSASAGSDKGDYILVFNSDVNPSKAPGSFNTRYYGYSVRCVAK